MNNATVSGSYLQIVTGTNARFNQTVTLTNYNYLKITGKLNDTSNYSYFQIWVSTSASASSSSNSTVASTSAYSSTKGGTVTVILDISSLSGNYYIYILPYGYISTGAVTSSSSLYGNVSAIWLSTT